MITLKTIIKEDVCIIRTDGYIDEHGGLALYEEVIKNLSEGQKKIVVNFLASPVINSQGIAQIIELCEIVIDEKNCELVFAGLSELASGVFKMVGLLQVTDMYKTEDEAFEALSE